MVILPTSFYERDTVTVAQELLGTYLVLETAQGKKIGRISETEAYLGITDKASHSSRGRTPRTEVLFGPAGIIYVYLIYGMYHCLNVVTDQPETGGAVLIRSVQPISGVEGKTSGPGLVCKAYGIDRTYNGLPITQPPLTIQYDPATPQPAFESLPRIGIDYADEDRHLPYRFRIAER